jgi:hypothetical protein
VTGAPVEYDEVRRGVHGTIAIEDQHDGLTIDDAGGEPPVRGFSIAREISADIVPALQLEAGDEIAGASGRGATPGRS